MPGSIALHRILRATASAGLDGSEHEMPGTSGYRGRVGRNRAGAVRGPDIRDLTKFSAILRQNQMTDLGHSRIAHGTAIHGSRSSCNSPVSGCYPACKCRCHILAGTHPIPTGLFTGIARVPGGRGSSKEHCDQTYQGRDIESLWILARRVSK